jgi:hypothetical protein
MTPEIGAEFLRGWLYRAEAQTCLDDQQQSSRKYEGDEHVIEIKEKRNDTAPNNLHASGDARGFGRERGA